MSRLVIIDYGAGNVQSLQFALERLGIESVLSREEKVIRNADKVIFPGVGAAGHAMKALKKVGLEKIIPELKQPVLGICLGMQLMCHSTEEDQTEGLGIFDVPVLKFEARLKVPHMGWNEIQALNGDLFGQLREKEFMYFVHSYYVPLMEHTAATCDYVQPFSAALQKDNFYACQFHPEKSGAAGEKVLKAFLEMKSPVSL